MKIKKLFIITSIVLFALFFTACSDKQKNLNAPSKNASIYDIMGITKPKYKMLQVVRKEKNINLKKDIKYSPSISPDVEYISYKKKSYLETLEEIEEIETVEEIESEPFVIEESSYTLMTPIEVPYIPIDPIEKRPYKLIDSIQANAKQFLGVPYVWGATGPSKFDCSGFTQWVYRDVGIKIPRVSRDQAKVGEYVRYEDLQKGDMVFFDTKKHRKGIVTHVGIYLGNGDFIHASSAGKKVVIYNFNEKTFYKERFLWGRRLTRNNFLYASN